MKEYGDIVELSFTLKALLKGFVVSDPIGDVQKYDRIVDVDGKLSRVQIKGTSTKGSQKNYRCGVGHGRSSKTPYTKEDCDFIAIYVVPRDVWYIIPIEVISDRKAIRLGIDSSCKYVEYKERWDLFY